MSTRRGAANAALAILLIVALALRLHNIGFGLPSLYDPDEPIFMVKAVELLTNHTLNPKWFGHPGTTTIYLIAVLDVGVMFIGRAAGAWHSIGGFSKAAFADPTLLFLPARTAMAILGVVSVWLTYRLGRRLNGHAVGLIAGAFLALNAIHITWSQVIRTDIHASVFMLVSLLFAIGAGETGKTRDYLLAGFFAGFAVATKWPAVTIFIAVIGAAVGRLLREDARPKVEIGHVILAGIALLAGLFLASPYIFLDWPTVLANLSNEARPEHLGHTGDGFFANCGWYLWDPVRQSFGLIGLLLIGGGFVLSTVRSAAARWTLVPAALAFLVLISAQHLIWSRWLLPLLPMLAIFAGTALAAVAAWICSTIHSSRPILVTCLVAAVALVPSIAAAAAESAERANDTRSQAASWARDHIPPGSSVVLEHLELGLRDQPWKIIFPLGDAGCVDAKRILSEGVAYQEVEQLRHGSPIVNLGNVPAWRLASCRADYAILTYYDRYRAEQKDFPRELGNYEKLLAGGRTVALFGPRPGHAGGPLVRVVALGPH